jgi:hypothetical protein
MAAGVDGDLGGVAAVDDDVAARMLDQKPGNRNLVDWRRTWRALLLAAEPEVHLSLLPGLAAGRRNRPDLEHHDAHA